MRDKTDNRTWHTSPPENPTCNNAPAEVGGMPCFERPAPLYKRTPTYNQVLTFLKYSLILTLLTGCHKKTVQVFPDEGEVIRKPIPAVVVEKVKDGTGGTGEVKRVSPLVVEEELSPVYFDFDRAEVRLSEVGELRRWVGAIRGKRVVLSGYCDERGSVQYNFGLGQRRAVSVMRWLRGNGVAGEIRCVSYGKGHLVRVGCGGDEGCHEKNRRVEMRVE